MIVGILKEIKTEENRVFMTPAGVEVMSANGHVMLVEIANKGWKKAMQESDEIKLGANVIDGKVTYKAVAEAFGLETVNIDSLL